MDLDEISPKSQQIWDWEREREDWVKGYGSFASLDSIILVFVEFQNPKPPLNLHPSSSNAEDLLSTTNY